MNNKKTFKAIFGLILILGSFIAAVVMAILQIVYRFQNPEFTQTQIMLERPEYTVGSMIIVIIVYVGWFLLK